MLTVKTGLTRGIIIFVLLGLLFTYPLIRYFNVAVPYERFPDEGSEIVSVAPGDYLQTYYWFWLMKDNLFGESRLFKNPYEFNSQLGEPNYGFYMFPLSLFFVIFSPLGEIAAYNCVIIVSFVLAGLSLFLLTYFYTRNVWAGIVAGVIFSFAPYRLAQVLSGHMNGFLVFLIPLSIYFCEVSWERHSVKHSIFAGLCIFSLAVMEFHLLYYMMLFFLLYFPFRMLTVAVVKKKETGANEQNSRPSIEDRILLMKNAVGFRYPLQVAVLGLIAGIFYYSGQLHHQKTVFTPVHLLFIVLFYPALAVTLWLFFSAFLALLGRKLSLSELLREDASTFLPLAVLLLYLFQFRLNVPHGGKILLLLSLGSMLALKIRLFWHCWGQGGFYFRGWKLREHCRTLIPLVVLTVGAIGYVFYLRTSLMSGSFTASGGRSLSVVRLFSPTPDALFTRFARGGEQSIYLGTVALLLLLLAAVRNFFRLRRAGNRPELYNTLFYLLIFLLPLSLSFGPRGKAVLPFYDLAYRFLPYFDHIRVPGRITTLSITALSLLAGMGTAALADIVGKRKKRVYPIIVFLLLLLIVVDYYPGEVIGLSKLKTENNISAFLAKESNKEEVVLHLPIFPGDSHQSSIYEYWVTATGTKMVNGYNPIVSQEYVDKVFEPLQGLNVGYLEQEQYELLREIGVKYLVLHEALFFYKVSPFTGCFTRRRLETSEWLKLRLFEDGVALFELIPPGSVQSEQIIVKKEFVPDEIGVPYEAENFRRQVGKVVEDLDASGKRAVMAESSTDSKGFLLYGFYQFFPPGDYILNCWLQTDNDDYQDERIKIGVIDVSIKHGRQQLVQHEIYAGDFSSRDYEEVFIPFTLSRPEDVELRVYYTGVGKIRVDHMLVSFASKVGPGWAYEAEELYHQVGRVELDPTASGDHALVARISEDHPSYLTFGPYREYHPGNYEIVFYLKVGESMGESSEEDNIVAILDVSAESGQRIFTEIPVRKRDFTEAGVYQPFSLPVGLGKTEVLEFHVFFTDKADLWVDWIEVKQ